MGETRLLCRHIRIGERAVWRTRVKTLQILERAHFPKGKSYLNRFLFYGILIIWGLSIVLPIFYFLFQWIFIYNLGFINGAIGNWFATIVGVLAGVPPALWLAGWQQKRQELRDEKRLEIGLLNK